MKSLPISLPLLASLTLPCLAAIAQNYTITRTPTFPTDADSQRLLNQGIFDFCAAEWKPTQDITTHLTIYTLEGPRAGTERTALVGPWVLLTAEIEDFKKAFGDKVEIVEGVLVDATVKAQAVTTDVFTCHEDS